MDALCQSPPVKTRSKETQLQTNHQASIIGSRTDGRMFQTFPACLEPWTVVMISIDCEPWQLVAHWQAVHRAYAQSTVSEITWKIPYLVCDEMLD